MIYPCRYSLALEMEVDALKSVNATLTRQKHNKSHTRTSAPRDTTSYPSTRLISPEIIKKAIARQDVVFYQESIDSDWSLEQADMIQSLLDKLIKPSTIVLDLNCRSKTCRLELLQDFIETNQPFDSIILGLASRFNNVNANYIVLEDGGRKSVYYFSIKNIEV